MYGVEAETVNKFGKQWILHKSMSSDEGMKRKKTLCTHHTQFYLLLWVDVKFGLTEEQDLEKSKKKVLRTAIEPKTDNTHNKVTGRVNESRNI
jgi:hypothetical protein